MHQAICYAGPADTAWRDGCPLRVWRQAEGLTQFEAAIQLGVTPSAIANYESGRQVPGPNVMRALSRRLPSGGDTTALLAEWAEWRAQQGDQ